MAGDYDISDFTIMRYYYYTHRRSIDVVDYENGMAGYTGIIQELISEIPSRGSDRLQRKLSVDVNELMPKVVRDPGIRQRMVTAAEGIAAQHGPCLYAPVGDGIGKPLFDMMYEDGLPRQKRKTCIQSFQSFLSFFLLYSV
jgi:hypothetical protein